jgi:hypothetical protein
MPEMDPRIVLKAAAWEPGKITTGSPGMMRMSKKQNTEIIQRKNTVSRSLLIIYAVMTQFFACRANYFKRILGGTLFPPGMFNLYQLTSNIKQKFY